MIFGKESEILEFKKTTGELKEAVISVSSILNKHGAGELYFGIKNDGTVLGQQIGDATLRDVSKALSDNLKPQIFPSIDMVSINDKHCIRIAFEGDTSPYYAYGRVYIRVADEDKQMSPEEVEKYIIRKNAGRDLWDSEISNKTINDVDEKVLRDYIERANLAKRIDFTYTTKEDVLHKLELTDGEKLNNAAFALFVGSRMLEVQMAIFAGTERLTFNDIKRENGNITTLIEVAETYIRNNIRWRVVLDGSIKRKEIPEIPIDAIREALVNSYCHRQYTSSQNNEITIYSDRIEIYNPGTFPEGLSPQDFLEGRERSIKRNPNLAQLLYYTRDIESFGTGLKRISDACDEANVKVEFQLLKKGFAVVFYRPNEQFNTTEKVPDVVLNVVTNVVLNDNEQAALSIIKENPMATAEYIATHLSKAARTAQRYLDSLQKKNVIRRVGAKKDGHWEIVSSDE